MVKLPMGKDQDRWECVPETSLEFKYGEATSHVVYFKCSGCFDIYAHNSKDLLAASRVLSASGTLVL